MSYTYKVICCNARKPSVEIYNITFRGDQTLVDQPAVYPTDSDLQQ